MREEICVRRKGPPASEDELDRAPQPPPLSTDAGGINLFGNQNIALAAAGSSVRGAGGPRSLSARAPLEPVAVFLGRSPGSGTAPMAANARPIPAQPGAPETATAFVGDRTRTDGAGGVTGSGPIVLAPAAMVPLKAGAGIGSGAKPATAPRLGAIAPATAKPASKPAPQGKATATATPGKPTPARTTPAKPAPAKASPVKTTSPKAAPAKTTPAKTTPAKATPAKTTPAKTTPANPVPAAGAAKPKTDG